jgi:hypothetical protein
MTTGPLDEPSLDAAGEASQETPQPPAPLRVQSGLLRRVLRLLVAFLTAQYTLIAIGTGLSVAGTAKYIVTPHIIAKFEAVTAALKR